MSDLPRDVEPLRDIIHRALARYLTVRPAGLIIDDGAPPRPEVDVRILSFGGARTLYQRKKPSCRSLDGVTSTTHSDRRCADCDLRAACTPQVRLDLMAEAQPFRLLIAYTSAKNFLVYEAASRKRHKRIEDSLQRITVVNRGSWGELRFSEPSP